MRGRKLLFAAYVCSGVAGLVYEVTWTRLLTLWMGHTTAAVSTVVAAFMGGSAVGAAVGGRVAARLTPRRALHAYAVLELAVAVIAVMLGWELALLTPILKFAYADGHTPVLFPLVRLSASLALLSVPAAALGATYPLALRWVARASSRPDQDAGNLYAANTMGASLGAIGAGFVLLPALGLFRTTFAGVAASVLAAGLVLLLARRTADDRDGDDLGVSHRMPPDPDRRPGRRALAGRSGRHDDRATRAGAGANRRAPAFDSYEAPGLAAMVLGLTGFATFMYEIAWTRAFSLIVGPSTYAVSTTLSAVIAGTALGSLIGSWLGRWLRRPAVGLVIALGAAAVALAWNTTIVGSAVPRAVMHQWAGGQRPFGSILIGHSLLLAGLVLPVATALGVAFPLALQLVGSKGAANVRRVGLVYAINTAGSVAGSLIAGFVTIPAFGLERTLWIAVSAVVVAVVSVAAAGKLSRRAQAIGLAAAAAALTVVWFGERWDRDLLASGAYKYARHAPADVDLETTLTAGSLLYYREGAVATVSVKRLTGNLSLSVDGKVDASTSGDMLTQKLLAHLPLLLHPNPRDVAIIGLGSGVTLGTALRHPIRSAEVIELSPEVVDASAYFRVQNRDGLHDPRTRLIVADGRSHMLLGSGKYDVIISEPSNPWMAGVAALFTREFFEAMRARLAPGGLICQWAHSYDISDADLRSVVGTFLSVFPSATVWLVGEGDLLMIGGDQPIEEGLVNITRNWERPGIARDLSDVGAREPFAILSMFLAGGARVREYVKNAEIQRDDRLSLEFSGPAAMYGPDSGGNIPALRALRDQATAPRGIAAALANATAAQWRTRAAMMSRVSAYDDAFENYRTALSLDGGDADALAGLVVVAVAARRADEAVDLLQTLAATGQNPVRAHLALSKLFAARGAFDAAIAHATEACRLARSDLAAWEQLASILSDRGDAEGLEGAAHTMRQLSPQSADTLYYTAAAHFLRGRLDAALPEVQRAIAADPRRAAAHNLLGAIHGGLGNTDAARRAFTAAMQIDPRDSATYTNLAVLELNAHNPSAAHEWFAEALSLDPSSPAARAGLLQARHALGRTGG